MSKLRIYELAKELGLDNRVVLLRAQEMGMPGKNSHSNSLDADEVEQLRRSFSRQASKPGKDSEVVTTRVDKLSGATEAIVERRKGNVIRRRRAGSSDEAVESTPSSVSGSPEAANVASDENTGPGAVESVVLAPPAAENSTQPTAPEASDEPGSDECKLEVEDAPRERELHVVPPMQPAPVVSEVAATSSSLSQPVAGRGQSNAAVEMVASASVAKDVAAVVDVKKGIGPKILGRMELPVRKPIARPEVKGDGRWGIGVAGPAMAVGPEEGGEDDEESWRKKQDKKRRARRREISSTDLVDYDGRAGSRKQRSKKSSDGDEYSAGQTELTMPKASKRVVAMSDVITVGELAKQMSSKSADVISKLMQLGVLATINQAIDFDTATIVAEEFGFTVESTSFDEKDYLGASEEIKAEDMVPRPPVVTVMGHVDHGKTSLLDAIREAAVAEKEAGGITQHIGAYSVMLSKEDTPEGVRDGRITFIDTPGHAAFTAMRARGAQVTDIVILVVAADDGVMPQTIEAINHAKAAKVTIVVAVNKIDKHGANIERIKTQLTDHGLQPEDWGGETMYFPVSALKKQGLKELLGGVLLLAEMRELKASASCRARGTVIESRQDRGRGAVTTVLVQQGTLRVGDAFVSGSESGRVRSMTDHLGTKIEAAGPSTPVEITGLSGVPEAGDDFLVVESEADARSVAENRHQERFAKEQRALGAGPISLEEFARRANNVAAVELNVILKADVHGSVEAVREGIEKLSTDKVKVRVLHAAVGGVNESDIQLATASKAVVVAFGVRAESRVVIEAEASGVEIRYYRIIYELIDDVKKAMAGLLAPVKQESRLGRVEVRNTFSVPKLGLVAGSFVVEGIVRRGASVRLLRDSKVVHEGKMASLRRFKDDVKEVQAGYECGIGLESYNDIKVGDVLEVYEFKEVAATL